MSAKNIRIITYGGLGDILLTTPVIEALKKKLPASRIFIYGLSGPYMEIFKNNPYVSRVSDISFFRNPITYILYRFRWAHFHTFHYGRLSPNLFYQKGATEIIAEVFNVSVEDKKIQIFLTKQEEEKAQQTLLPYNKPVIIHISSMTSKNQEWPLQCWEELVGSMQEYTFIQLGLATEHKVQGAIDLRGKTSFRETFALIKYATGFAGINSSLSHVTNAFDTPGVVLFGPSPPVIWGHPNNINIYKKLRCSPCVDLLREACPYSQPCMTQITVDEVRQALLQQLLRKEYVNA